MSGEQSGARAGVGHLVSAFGAVVALISLWLPWWSIDLDKVKQLPAFKAGVEALIPSQQLRAEINRYLALLPSKIDGTGWDVMTRGDIFFAIAAAAVIALFFAVIAFGADGRPVAQVMAFVGVVGMALLLYKMASPGLPAETQDIVSRRYGFFVSLVGWTLCAAGGIYEFRNPPVRKTIEPATVPVYTPSTPVTAADESPEPVRVGVAAVVTETERPLVPDFHESAEAATQSIAPPT